jgi:hypothetical protein
MPTVTLATVPLTMRKSVIFWPATKLPVWHERVEPTPSHLMPLIFATTSASLDPTPMSDVVRSPLPVVSTAVTFSRPWNVTRMPPE